MKASRLYALASAAFGLGLHLVPLQAAPATSPNDANSAALLTEAPALPAAFTPRQELRIGSRNYSERLDIDGGTTRTAWVQGVQLSYAAGVGDARAGLGFEGTLFGALKLHGGTDARNMVHVGPGGVERDARAWAYPGTYVLKAQVDGVTARAGLQTIVNPFIQPYDNRALPPTFRGVAIDGQAGGGLVLAAGSFDAVMARGFSHLQALSTAYGGQTFKHLAYAGADWRPTDRDRAALYLSRATDVWDQHYLSLEHRSVPAGQPGVGLRADLYSTRGQGARRQDAIDNQAYSIALVAEQGKSELAISYQRIHGDQFFDFVQETTGSFLANSGGADYNAPHEQSLRVKWRARNELFGIRGLQGAVWAIAGWGADASREAQRFSVPGTAMHAVYWKNGRPKHGRHGELGIKPSFTVQQGRYKNAEIILTVIRHRAGEYYPIKGFLDFRLNINVPLLTR